MVLAEVLHSINTVLVMALYHSIIFIWIKCDNLDWPQWLLPISVRWSLISGTNTCIEFLWDENPFPQTWNLINYVWTSNRHINHQYTSQCMNNVHKVSHSILTWLLFINFVNCSSQIIHQINLWITLKFSAK